MRKIILFILLVGVLFTENVEATDYYFDPTIASSCVDYDPVSFACGAGAAQAFKTATEMYNGIAEGSHNLYFRKDQTFTETAAIRFRSGWTLLSFGAGAKPILSFNLTNAVDWRSDAVGVHINGLDMRTSSGSLVRFYGSTAIDVNMTDVLLTAAVSAMASYDAASTFTVTFNLDNVKATAGTGNALVIGANGVFTGTIARSSFISTSAQSISFQNGLISNLTFSGGSANGGGVNGAYITGDVNGLSFIDFDASLNTVCGLFIYPAEGKTQQNINILRGHYNYNTVHGVGINQTGTLTSLTVNGPELAYNKIDGLNTYGTIPILVEHSNVHHNGTGGDNIGRGDGLAFHGNATATVRYNHIHDNLKYQVHAIDTVNLSAYYNLISASEEGREPALVWLHDSATANLYNNTIVFSKAGPASSLILTTAAGGGGTHNIKNNALIGGVYSIVHGGIATHSYDYNDYFNYTTGTINGGTDGGHSISSDPLFLSEIDYHLGYGSPLVNKGVNVGLAVDYDGIAINGLPDIGAYERPTDYVPWKH